MKVLRAMIVASVCALTVGSTSAPLLDVERTDTNVIIVEPQVPRSIGVTETPTMTITKEPAETTEATEATTTDVLPVEAQDVRVVVKDGALPSP